MSSIASSQQQEFIVLGSPCIIRQMQISHRGLYVVVPHYLLDGQQIAAVLDHNGSWRVPE
jgi:hypothetical protein